MIARILTIVFVALIIIYIGYWIFTGGLSRAIGIAKSLDNPLNIFGPIGTSTSGEFIRLPGQPDQLLPGIDITEYSAFSDDQSTRDKLDALQDQYDQLYAQAKQAKNFGEPSPHRGEVKFGYNTATENSVAAEFVTLEANYQNTAPVSLAGWTLQSAVTSVRVPLPQAAPLFIGGVLNAASPVTLSPGEQAIVVSGRSPVGVSFRENKCTGYLNELQSFVPQLERNCPVPADDLSITAENIRAYGDECIDYAKNLAQCHFPGLDQAPSVLPDCKALLLNRFSYNGCVQSHKLDTGFQSKTWRLYFGVGTNLWRDTHDVVRLLDEEGRTVDVLTY